MVQFFLSAETHEPGGVLLQGQPHFGIIAGPDCYPVIDEINIMFLGLGGSGTEVALGLASVSIANLGTYRLQVPGYLVTEPKIQTPMPDITLVTEWIENPPLPSVFFRKYILQNNTPNLWQSMSLGIKLAPNTALLLVLLQSGGSAHSESLIYANGDC